MICLNGEINFEIIIMTLQDGLTNRQILLYHLEQWAESWINAKCINWCIWWFTKLEISRQ